MFGLGLSLDLAALMGGGAVSGNALNLVMIGDSIINDAAYSDATYFSGRTAALIGQRQTKTVNLTRIGQSGQSWNYSYQSGTTINQHITNNIAAVAAADRVVMFAGTNGLKLGGKTPAQEYADFEVGLALVTGQGVSAANIVVCTMLPREDYSDSNRTTYNNLIISGAATHGYKVAEFHLNRDIGVDGQQHILKWYDAAKIHPIPAAADQMARIVYDQFYNDFYAAFTPAQLPGYYDHWDAQVLASITQSAGRVSQWQSATGLRPLTAPASGNEPLYAATGFNGLPTLTFDGASRRAQLRNLAIAVEAKDATIYSVQKLDNVTGDHFFVGLYRTNSWEDGTYFKSSGTQLQMGDGINGGAAAATGHADTAARLLSAQLQPTNPTASIYKDGVNYAIGAPTNVAASVPATALLLGSPPLDFWRHEGQIAEVGIIGAGMTSYWHQLLAKHLAAKWGMAAPNVP